MTEINQATKNDPWNLHFGGFVTSETFIEAASEAKEPKPKAAPKRKLGQQITRNANTSKATEDVAKTAAERRRLQPRACPPPNKKPFRQQLGTVPRTQMSLICM